jgi:hypothetical protein
MEYEPISALFQGLEPLFGIKVTRRIRIKVTIRIGIRTNGMRIRKTAFDTEKARLCPNFLLLENCAKYLSGSETGTGTKTFPKSEPESLRLHNTGTYQ